MASSILALKTQISLPLSCPPGKYGTLRAVWPVRPRSSERVERREEPRPLVTFLSLVLSTVPGTEVDGRSSGGSRGQRALGFSWLRPETQGLEKLRSDLALKMMGSTRGKKRQEEPQEYLHPSICFHRMVPAMGVCGRVDLGYWQVK